MLLRCLEFSSFGIPVLLVLQCRPFPRGISALIRGSILPFWCCEEERGRSGGVPEWIPNEGGICPVAHWYRCSLPHFVSSPPYYGFFAVLFALIFWHHDAPPSPWDGRVRLSCPLHVMEYLGSASVFFILRGPIDLKSGKGIINRLDLHTQNVLPFRALHVAWVLLFVLGCPSQRVSG